MALGTWVAGRYSGTTQYPAGSAVTMGILRDGWTVSWQNHKQVLAQTDAYGRSPIEAFYQGTSVFVSGIAKEWLANVIKSINPINGWAGTGAATFSMGTISVQDTDTAGILVLTATTGTPAATSPATLTATYAILQEDFDVSLLFGPEQREMPFRFRIYPYSSSGIKFFTTT